jgi:hypothetical protein
VFYLLHGAVGVGKYLKGIASFLVVWQGRYPFCHQKKMSACQIGQNQEPTSRREFRDQLVCKLPSTDVLGFNRHWLRRLPAGLHPPREPEQYPRAHSGNVIWIDAAGSNPGTFTRYQVATGTYSTIIQPSGSNYLINNEYDFFVDGNGQVVFFFGAQSGGEGVTSTFDVYCWSSLSNTSTKLSGGGARSVHPKTDGQTVAWRYQQALSVNSSEELHLKAANSL